MKTLSEVVELVGMSRRIIQEYEDAGLAIKPTHRNAYGHLLYGNKEISRLWLLRFYKELGYKKDDIRKNFHIELSKQLDTQIDLLIKKKEELDNLINVATLMKETGITPMVIHSTVAADTDLSYTETFNAVGALSKYFLSFPDSDDTVLDSEYDKAFSQIEKLFESIIGMWKQGISSQATEVQEKVLLIHKAISPFISESIVSLSMAMIALAPGGELAAAMDADYGEGSSVFFYDAVSFYCDSHIDNPYDNALNAILEEIIRLKKSKHNYDSDEVQAEINKWFKLFLSSNAFAEKDIILSFRASTDLFKNKSYCLLYDKWFGKNSGIFIGKAIQVFCDNYS